MNTKRVIFFFSDNSDQEKNLTEPIKFDKVIILFLLIHFLGVVMMNIPQYVTKISDQYDYNVQTSIFFMLIGLSVIFLLIAFLVPFRSCESSMNAFGILAMLELGTALICISMNNFSLGMFCAVVSAPLALFMNPTSCRWVQGLSALPYRIGKFLVICKKKIMKLFSLNSRIANDFRKTLYITCKF